MYNSFHRRPILVTIITSDRKNGGFHPFKVQLQNLNDEQNGADDSENKAGHSRKAANFNSVCKFLIFEMG